MEPTIVNSFLDRFIAVADAGFGLIQGDVGYVLNALIVISIVLAGAQWALAQEAPIAPFFRKVLFVGLFAFLVNNWNALATAINQSGAELGLRAGGGGLSLPDLHNPGRIAEIGSELFGQTVELGEGMNIITDFLTLATILIAAVAVLLAFFILALQIFVALIAFKIGSLVAFVALPWGVFNGTSWVAERPLGWVVGSAMRLFVLALIASVAINFVASLPGAFSLDDGGVLNVLLFGLTILALAWFGPQLASEVVQGQPHLSGADAMRSAVGAAAVSVGAGMLAAGAARAGVRAVSGLRGRSSARGGRSGGAGSRPAPVIDHGRFQPPRPSTGSSSSGKQTP
ncbi:MAG: P-type conjugative transfer protein TrbL [Hyphomonadaceae bacterium]|nr:P-type conjugative transfer protein TrbL [Hyphomonadaceae bacterium]